MVKYTIRWNEYTLAEGKDLKKFMDTLPNPKIIGHDSEQTIIRCIDTFSATSDEEAKKYVSKQYYGVETAFDVLKNGKVVFTEEDIEG